MKVTVESYTDSALDERDDRDMMRIKIDGEQKFFVMDDEPEDSNLSRAFNDCLSIPDLMQMAYEAGKRGDSFDVEWVKVDE